MSVRIKSKTMPTIGLRAGSTGDLALRYLMAHGRTGHSALALAIEKPDDELGTLIGFAIKAGFIRAVDAGGAVAYEVGDGVQAALPPKPSAMPKAPWPATAPAPAPMVAPQVAPAPPAPAAVATVQALHIPRYVGQPLKASVPVPPPPPPPPAPAPTVDAAPYPLSDRDQASRMLLPMLGVQTMDVARFAGGRLLLQLDGVAYILPPELAQRLQDHLEFA